MTRRKTRSNTRKLLRHGDKRYLDKGYEDVQGYFHDLKLAAQISSFLAIVAGCFRNGFPVVRKTMRYAGWSFWPFFFIHARTDVNAVKTTINHERIHIRQQWDIHRIITFPLLIAFIILEFCGHRVPLVAYLGLPFIPTILYGFDMLRVLLFWRKSKGKITFTSLRESTCFEAESRAHQLNDDYLRDRKFCAMLKHIG